MPRLLGLGGGEPFGEFGGAAYEPGQAFAVQDAQELLEKTDESIDTIAAATGMGTATTLRRHFNRALGVPPDTYRRTFRSRTRPSPGR